jgi:hypothetical protein
MKLLIWLIYPVTEALVQANLIQNKGWKPNYFQLFIIRGFFAIMFGAIILQLEYDLEQTLVWLAWCTSSFFAVFNPLLNKLRDKPFAYRGATSGWLDRIFLSNTVVFYLFYIFCVFTAGYCLARGWNIF